MSETYQKLTLWYWDEVTIELQIDEYSVNSNGGAWTIAAACRWTSLDRGVVRLQRSLLARFFLALTVCLSVAAYFYLWIKNTSAAFGPR